MASDLPEDLSDQGGEAAPRPLTCLPTQHLSRSLGLSPGPHGREGGSEVLQSKQVPQGFSLCGLS